MSHYFINDDSLKSEKRIIKYTINSHYFELTSDIGVFSKNELDPGSELLIKTAIKEGIKGELLDVGCGYGPIGITLSKICDLDKVDFIDVNLRALNLTKENAIKYKVKNFNVFESNGFENVKDLYDYILINPPIRAGKEVIFKMFENSINYLKGDVAPEGMYFISANESPSKTPILLAAFEVSGTVAAYAIGDVPTKNEENNTIIDKDNTDGTVDNNSNENSTNKEESEVPNTGDEVKVLPLIVLMICIIGFVTISRQPLQRKGSVPMP